MLRRFALLDAAVVRRRRGDRVVAVGWAGLGWDLVLCASSAARRTLAREGAGMSVAVSPLRGIVNPSAGSLVGRFHVDDLARDGLHPSLVHPLIVPGSDGESGGRGF